MKLNSYLKLLVLLLALSCLTNANAKDKETKLAKNIVFVGNIVEKAPMGLGTIKCTDPKDKENPILILEGTFNNTTIKDAVIKTTIFNGLGLTGDFSYSVKTDDDKNQVLVIHSITNSKINYSHNNITVNNAKIGQININHIGLSVRYDRNSKTWDYQLIGNSDIPQESITQTIEYPAAKCPIELSSFGYNNENLSKSLCPIVITKNGVAQSGGIKFLFTNSDEYCNNELNLHTGGSFNIASETVWSGHRVFETATVRKKESNNNTITIEYKNGDSFEGIVNNTEDIRKVLGYGSSFSSIKPWEGSGIVNGKPEKWIKGETLTKRHARLSEFLDEDLVLKVEQDSITEEQGKTIMRERENERIHQETLQVMRNYWGNNKQVGFEGEITGLPETDQVLSAMFGFDHTFITGKAMLALDDNKHGVFAFITEPNQKALSYGRGKALQIATFCRDEFTKKYSGEWKIKDNTIFIDGKECGTLSSDGKTVTYTGMLSSKMKLTITSIESAIKE